MQIIPAGLIVGALWVAIGSDSGLLTRHAEHSKLASFRARLDEVEAALTWLVLHPVQGLSPTDKRRRFEDAWKVYGRSALMLSGGGAQMPLLRDFLAERHGVVVQVTDPLRQVGYDPALFADRSVQEVAPLLAVGVGLGLRRME